MKGIQFSWKFVANIAAGLLGVIALIGIGIANWQSFSALGVANEIRANAPAVEAVSHLSDTLQNERGATIACLMQSSGCQSDEKLAAARQKTNVELSDLAGIDTARGRVGDDLARVRAALADLTAHRQDVDDGQSNAIGSFDFYTKLTGDLIGIESSVADAVAGTPIARLASARHALSLAQEWAGQQRANGVATINTKLGNDLRIRRGVKTANLTEVQRHLFDTASQLTPAWKDQLKGIGDIEVMAADLATDASTPLDVWWETTSSRIKKISTIRHEMLVELEQQTDAYHAEAQLHFIVYTVMMVFTILANAFITFVLRYVGRDLDRIIEHTRDLAQGELDILIDPTSCIEFRPLVAALETFAENGLALERERAARETDRQNAEKERKAAMQQLAARFDAEVGRSLAEVTGAASQMETAATAMSATANQTSSQAEAVATATGEASSNVETVAAAAEELAASIAEISRQVSDSSMKTHEAANQAGHAGDLITSLETAVGHIGDVVKLITDVASQTNLLALNATIEAARAGEAGKGFAVVANEVKNLANQTTRATDEISAQITAVQQATHEAVGAIRDIVGTIDGLNNIAASIAAAVEEQGAATHEIARNVQQAAAGTHVVTHNVAGVQVAASETGVAAEQVLSSAHHLAHEGAKLRTAVDHFLDHIQAT